MEDVDEICNTKLGLGIGSDDFEAKRDQQKNKNKAITCLDLSFPIHQRFDGEICGDNGKKIEGSRSKASALKGKEEEEERQSYYISNDSQEDHNNNGVIRKKLRLTTEQSSILENSFRQQTTLNTAQKQALAQRLNLKPRQVEVWFQNRRARTKLKQTEVDCEYLRKRCENLNEENRRLKKELQELRLSKMEKSTNNPPFYVQLQKAAKKIARCPYCENVGRTSLIKMNAAAEVKLETITTVVATTTATVTVAGEVVNDKPSNVCHRQQGGRGFNLNISEFERESSNG